MLKVGSLGVVATSSVLNIQLLPLEIGLVNASARHGVVFVDGDQYTIEMR